VFDRVRPLRVGYGGDLDSRLSVAHISMVGGRDSTF
jgi:hypothetical protein